MMAYQEILDAIAVLSEEEQEELFELIRKQRIEARRVEISANAQVVMEAFKNGTGFIGTAEDLMVYLSKED